MSDFKLLFDGDCRMCQKLSKIVLFLKRSDSIKVEPFQVHLETNQEIPYHELNSEIHFIGNGYIFKGHNALIELSRYLSCLKYLYPLLKLYPISKLIQGIYFLAKKYRKSSNACKLK